MNMKVVRTAVEAIALAVLGGTATSHINAEELHSGGEGQEEVVTAEVRTFSSFLLIT